MKNLVDFISESMFTRNRAHSRRNNALKDKLYEYVDKYCDSHNVTSNNVGGTIAGALAYMLDKWTNGKNTCKDDDSVERANKYLCDDTELLTYSENFSDLSLVSGLNYEKTLYTNINVALDYFDEHPEIFKEKSTYNLFEK